MRRKSISEIINDFVPDSEIEAAQRETSGQIGLEEARNIGNSLGIDWNEIDIDQFKRGLEVELEHGATDLETDVTKNNPEETGRIAWAHLKEIPDYYSRLDRMEEEAKSL